jgi:mono/diheme cytochrome c family protein
MTTDPHAPERDPNAPERHALPSFDGIRELDSNPPRTWTVVYLTTLIAALGLLVAYPSIPFLWGGNSQGVFGWSSRADLGGTMERASTRTPAIQARFAAADLAEAERDGELRAYAVATGGAAFGQHCAACHGTQAQGGPGFPTCATATGSGAARGRRSWKRCAWASAGPARRTRAPRRCRPSGRSASWSARRWRR